MLYQYKTILNKNTGNNAFSYNERKALLGRAQIILPSIKKISHIDEIILGKDIVFEEIDHRGKLRSCTGLEHIYCLERNQISSELSPDLIIMDNHNHALFFWIQYILQHNPKNITLLHTDQHSDLNTPPLSFQQYLETQTTSLLTKKESLVEKNNTKQRDLLQYIRGYTNYVCNVGNFILPFLELYPQTHFTRIKSESQLLTSTKFFSSELSEPSKDPIKHSLLNKVKTNINTPMNTNINILDIDLDFRSPAMSITKYKETIEKTRQLITRASLVTIASSPYFLDQRLALKILHDLLKGRDQK